MTFIPGGDVSIGSGGGEDFVGRQPDIEAMINYRDYGDPFGKVPVPESSVWITPDLDAQLKAVGLLGQDALLVHDLEWGRADRAQRHARDVVLAKEARARRSPAPYTLTEAEIAEQALGAEAATAELEDDSSLEAETFSA